MQPSGHVETQYSLARGPSVLWECCRLVAALPEIETSPALEEAWGGTDTSELRASYLHAFRIAIYTPDVNLMTCQIADGLRARIWETSTQLA